MTNNKNYTAEDIRVLDDLEAVRTRPEMYIGSRGPAGLHHLVWEVVDNSVDEYFAGHCSQIDVVINRDGSVTISDNGRGMPVDMHEKTQKSALEVLFTMLHAGGKFSGKGYTISGGLHGIGVKAVNFLSKKLSVEVKRDGKIYSMEFKEGKKIKDLKSKRGKKTETGTMVTFYPDSKIFKETIEFDRKTITDRLNETAYLNPHLKINFSDLRDKNNPFSETYYSENGIIDLLDHKTQKIKSLTTKPFSVVNQDNIDRNNLDTDMMETVNAYTNVVFQYTSSDNENYYSFVNNIRTKGGEHVKGFRNAVYKAFNQAARESKILKDKDPDIRDKDALSGIVAIIYIKLPDPRFEGQTKENLDSKEANKFIYDAVYDEALSYFKKQKILLKKLIKFAKEQEKMRQELKATKEVTQEDSLLTNDSLPGKLSDCSSRNNEENELFIVEGDSAGGSAKQGRDRKYQAILALRGKVLNVQGAKVTKALSNAEINSMVTAIGSGVKDLCDSSKSRYGKIIFLTDADVDGAHITTLLLTFFYHYMKPLIESGRLFLSIPPLYKITYKTNVKKHKKGDVLYAYSDTELKKVTKGLSDSQVEIQRYKGLGEMNAEQLWETTMDPKTRKLEQVIMPDAIKAENQFQTFMGNNNDDKVDFIKKVIKAYKLAEQDVPNISDMEELAELDLSDDEVTKDIEKNLSQFKNIVDKNTALRVITDVLKKSIGDYAYYVNIKRSIPDIRDGLKPVQRRIVWAMFKERMFHDKAYKKCARVVGEVIGKYHPHGDSAVYDALVKLAQDFHENVPILDFHGNVGSIDGDYAAAMRYTETRLHNPAEDMLQYIDYNTVEMEDTYSYEYKEPLYLPGKFPYVLVNGTSGIGVSISTDIPAHNVLEVLNAIKFVIDNPNSKTKQIMKYIKGPNFPTGGLLIDDNLSEMYETGNGSYKVRAKMHTEVIKGKQALVITEIPYNVTKEKIIKTVSNLVQDKKVKKGSKTVVVPKKISDIVDYSDESDKKSGVRLIFFLKKTANAEKVKQQLYSLTPLEKSYKCNLLAIENEEIKIFTLKDMIDSYIKHRQVVLTRKYEYDLEKKESRKHLLEGYMKILRPLSNLDRAIEIIKNAQTTVGSRKSLMKEFGLTEVQAQYILDRKLSTLNKADVKDLREEIKQLKVEIKEIKVILGNIDEINKIIKSELDDMKSIYPIKRRTEIMSANKVETLDSNVGEVEEIEELYVGLDVNNKVKKVKAKDKKTVINSSRKGYPLYELFKTKNDQKLLGLTSQNMIIQSNLDALPYSTDKSKSGLPYDIKKDLQFKGTLQKIKVNYSGKDFVLLLFDNGEVEKMPIDYFQSTEYIYKRPIVDFLFVNEEDPFYINTKQGQLLATETSQLREGKVQQAINLDKEDEVLSIDYFDEKEYLFTITDNNWINLIPMNEFKIQGKGGKGIRYYKTGSKTGLPKQSIRVTSPDQSVYLTEGKKAKVVKLSKLTDVATRTVIGQDSKINIIDVIPLSSN